jgi:probable rRNA maturation factor
MEPGSSRGPAPAGHSQSAGEAGPRIEVIVADPAWHRTVRNAPALARRAARAAVPPGAGTPAVTRTVVLSSDGELKRLNARHRGRNAPTNVLTFDALASGDGGEIFVARGTVRREAQAAGRRAGHHLAHLIVHGMLHLQGHDHDRPGDARRMELAEARILGRLRLPNPWKPT